MTLKELIAQTDALIENTFTPEQKTAWVNEVEGYVQTEVLLLALDGVEQYSYEADKDKELLVRPPHDKLYRPYLLGQIQFHQQEYAAAQNSMALYSSYMSEFMRWFARVYRPADYGGRRPRGWRDHNV